MAARHGEYRRQAAPALFAPGKGKRPHPEWRWRQRAPPGEADRNLQAVWREGEPVSAGGTGYARYHAETGMLLIAEYGFLVTVTRVGKHRDPDSVDPSKYGE